MLLTKMFGFIHFIFIIVIFLSNEWLNELYLFT